jgi:ATP-dependent Clp protease ATP-binding subunit ClpA
MGGGSDVFERFTDAARDAVVRAQAEARELGHGYIGAEHLLLALLRGPDQPGVSVLRRLGVTADAFRSEIGAVVGPDGGLTATDADALGTLGIDLEQVRRHVEDSFGPGALDDPPGRGRRRGLLRRRSRRCDEQGRPVGHIPFSARAKRALERSLREALALHDRHIGVEHLVLGLLDPHGNAAVDVLRRLGVEPDATRRRIIDELGKAA